MRNALFLAFFVLFAFLATAGAAATSPEQARALAFLDRVFARLPATVPSEYDFDAWPYASQPTEEGFGLKPLDAPIDPEKVVKRIMDVDHYKGNVKRVTECRSIADPRFNPPRSVRFYQRVNLPVISDVQHELVLVDGGTRDGYRVLYWYNLGLETDALDPAKGARSEFSVGAWLVSPNAVGYALSNVIRRDDVNWLEWEALTKGADATASGVVEDNIDGMVAWARRSP